LPPDGKAPAAGKIEAQIPRSFSMNRRSLFSLFAGVLAALTFSGAAQAQGSAGIKMTVLFNEPKNVEDFERYYVTTHLPLVAALKGAKRIETARGLNRADGTPARIFRIFELWFDSNDQMAAFTGTPAWKAVIADMANFPTGGIPVVFVSKID
jgi:uncharacterized protein (TIGR02118 family)